MSYKPQKTVRERFWAKVDKNGPTQPRMDTNCWVWTGYTDNGYGKFHFRRTRWLAHRVRWILKHGDLAADELLLHKCDNRACIRVSHLYIGNTLQNAIDRESRGRGNQPQGEKHPKAKLTDDDVREIRRLALTMRGIDIHKLYPQVTLDIVYKVIRKAIWAHLP